MYKRQTLHLSDDATITVTQLACLKAECAPLETVIGLLRPGQPQRQKKIHKATDDVDAGDLSHVCREWGVVSPLDNLRTLFEET